MLRWSDSLGLIITNPWNLNSQTIVVPNRPLCKRIVEEDSRDQKKILSHRTILSERGRPRINYQTNYMGFAFNLLEILLIPIAWFLMSSLPTKGKVSSNRADWGPIPRCLLTGIANHRHTTILFNKTKKILKIQKYKNTNTKKEQFNYWEYTTIILYLLEIKITNFPFE